MAGSDLIRHCFDVHVADIGEVDFTFEEYEKFWKEHRVGDVYEMSNKDGRTYECKVAYYPLPDHRGLRALIEIDMGDYIDYRECPVRFLERKHNIFDSQ